MSRWSAYLLLVLFSFGAASRASAAVNLETVSASNLSARANHWNGAIAVLSNSGDKAIHANLFVRMNRMSNVDFVQPVWLPARSNETISLPIFCPFARPGQKATNYSAWLTLGTTGRIIARNSGDIFMPAVRNATLAVTGNNDQTTAGLAVQMRQQQGLSSVIGYSNSSRLPFLASEYDGVYAVFLARRRMNLAGQQIDAMRRWLVGGGRLWMQAPKVRDRVGQALLGADWTITRVGQTHTATLRYSGRSISPNVLHLKKAIHLVYLLAPGYTVVEKINGWPAVLTRRIGRGRVFICCVNGRGLLNKDKKGGANLWPIVQRFYQAANFNVPMAILKHSATSQIGYRISGRMVVGSILVGLTILLLFIGLALGRKDRLERLAPIAIALAVVAGVLLIINGKLNRGRVNLTVSTYQLATASPSQHLLAITGFSSIFSPQAKGAEMTTSSGFTLNAQSSFAKQTDVRMVAQSNGKFRWQNVHLPSGATLDVPFHSSRAADHLRPIVGTFGPAGLVISGPPSLLADLRDAAIVAPRRAVALIHGASGTRLAGRGQILPAGQFIQSAFLTRSQQRHNTIEARLFTAGGPTGPVLLGWPTKAMPLVHLTRHPVTMNQTLLVIPLHMENSVPGTHVTLPWPYLSYTLVPGPGQHAPAPVFDSRLHHWLRDLSSPAHIYIRFQLPRQVLPLKVTTALLTVKISSPGRPVSVKVSVHGRWVQVGSRTSGGGGAMNLRLTSAELADINSSGGWQCEVSVGGDANAAVTWHIKTVRLTVAGTVQPTP